MTTLYRVFDNNGELGRDLTVTEAAHIMLTADGYCCRIRLEDGLYNLYVSNMSQNSYGYNDKFSMWPDYSADTEEEVYENVIRLGGVNVSAMTEQEYQLLITEE